MSRVIVLPTVALINEEVDDNGNMVAYVKSTSEPLLWHPIVVARSGECMCGCKDFEYRHAPHRPHLEDGVCCKHIATFRRPLLDHFHQLFGGIQHAA